VAMAGTMVAFNSRGDHFIPPPVSQAAVLEALRRGVGNRFEVRFPTTIVLFHTNNHRPAGGFEQVPPLWGYLASGGGGVWDGHKEIKKIK